MQSEFIKFIRKNELYFVIIFFLILWLDMFFSSGMSTAGLNYLINDHAILKEHNQIFDFSEIFNSSFRDPFIVKYNDRFFPIYVFLMRITPHIFGERSFLYYFSSILVGLITSISFYKFARLINFSILVSLLFASLIVFGVQTSAYSYTFPVPAESTGTLFVSLALLTIALNRKQKGYLGILYDLLIAIFIVLAALNKESYILVIPGIIFFKIWYTHQKNESLFLKSLYVNRLLISILSIFFILVIIFIKTKVVSQGYAGVDQSTFNFENIRELFNFLWKNSILKSALVANVIYLFILLFARKLKQKFNPGFYIFSLLIIIPQFILYAKSGMENSTHYLFPMIIGLSLLTVYPLNLIESLSEKKIKALYIVASILIVLLAIGEYKVAKHYFIDKSHYLNNLEKMVSHPPDCLQSKENNVLVIGNPYSYSEPLPAYREFILEGKLHLNLKNIYLGTIGSIDSDLIAKNSNKDSVDLEHKFYRDKGSQQQHMEEEYKHNTLNSLNSEELKNMNSIVVFSFTEYNKDFQTDTNQWFNSKDYKLNLYPNVLYKDIDIGVFCRK